MRRMEFIRMRAVLRHEQTTGKPLLDQVEPGACGGPCQLAHPHLQVTMQPATQRRAPTELAAERHAAHPPREAFALNDGTQRRYIHAQDQWRSKHAFVADQCDFEVTCAIDRNHQRNEAVAWKVHIANTHIGLVQDFAKFEFHGFAFAEHPS